MNIENLKKQVDPEDSPIITPESHAYNLSVARATKSVNAAVIFNNIIFWVRINRRKDLNFFDGKTWMYQTIPEMVQDLPEFSIQQVKDALKLLVEKKYLIKGNYSKDKFDKTNWYTLYNQNWLDVIEEKFTKRSTDPIEKVHGPVRTGLQTQCINKEEDTKYKDTKEREHARASLFNRKKQKDTEPKMEKKSYRDQVKLSEDEYEKLLAQYGKEKLEWLLDYLDMKKSAKGMIYKSDYHVLIPHNWVNAEYEKQMKEKGSVGGNNENEKMAKKIKKAFDRQDIILGPDYIEFSNGMYATHIKFDDKEFKKKCQSELQKRKLKLESI